MTDSFMHNHQSALDSQREDDAIRDLQDSGIYPDPSEIYEDDLIDRYIKDLTPIELNFLENEDNELNTCNKCEIIKNTWDTDEFKWDCDHDLKGYTALCCDCYEKIGGEPLE